MKSALEMKETYEKLGSPALNHLLKNSDMAHYDHAVYAHVEGAGSETEKAIAYVSTHGGDLAFGLIDHGHQTWVPHTFVVGKDGRAIETSTEEQSHLPRIGLRMDMKTYRKMVGPLSSPWVFNNTKVTKEHFIDA